MAYRWQRWAAGACALSLGLALGSAANAAEIKVVTVGALRGALDALGPQYEKTAHDRLTITYTNPANLAKTLAGGRFDVIVSPAPPVEALGKALAPGTLRRVARTGIGIVVREGAPKPDLSTVAAFKRAVLAAPNVVYTDPTMPNGSGMLTQAILTEVGLLDAVKAKGTQQHLAQGKALIAKGDYAMGFFNISEAAAPGVVIAGPVPAPLQRYTNYDAAAFAGAPDAAAHFVTFLGSAEAAPVWRAARLEPMH